MAFCENCGRQLADGEVCNCKPASIQQANAQPSEGQPKRANKNKSKLPLFAGLVAILVIATIIIVVVITSKPYMKPINDFMDAINKKTTNQLNLEYTLEPDFCVTADKKVESALKNSDDHMDALEDNNDYLEDRYDNLDDEYDSWKLTFEMKSKERMDEDDLEDIEDSCNDYFDDYLDSLIDYYEDILDDGDFEDLADNFDITEKQAKSYVNALVNHYKAHEDVKITDGYEIKGKFIIKTDDDEYKTDTVTICVVKINGDWAYAGVVKGSVYFNTSSSDFDFISRYLSSSSLMD